MPAVIIGGIIAAIGTVGSQVYATSQEKSQQKKLLTQQDERTRAAEAKAAQADILASEAARKQIRQRRLAQTRTILTSPLGLTGGANAAVKTLG